MTPKMAEEFIKKKSDLHVLYGLCTENYYHERNVGSTSDYSPGISGCLQWIIAVFLQFLTKMGGLPSGLTGCKEDNSYGDMGN